jgi:hypothetical protein
MLVLNRRIDGCGKEGHGNKMIPNLEINFYILIPSFDSKFRISNPSMDWINCKADF